MPERTVSKQVEKLNETRQNAWTKLDPYRKTDSVLKQNFAGSSYMDNTGKLDELPYNKIQQQVMIYMRLLSSSRPQVLVSTEYDDLKPFANTIERSLDRRLIEIQIEKAFASCTLSAMFSVGVMKTGLGEGDELFEIDGQMYDPGMSFSAPVSLNNFIIDTMANDISQVGFLGDRYLRPKKWVMDNFEGVTAQEAQIGINPENASEYVAEERVSGVWYDPQYDVFDQVWMWDIYVPKTNILYTFIDGVEAPVKEIQWQGPESVLGPYDVLGFIPVPDEVMPIGPVNAAYPLHKTINNIGRKLNEQAERQKTVTGYIDGNKEDGARVRDAGDGTILRLDDVNSVREISYGGPDAMNNQMLIQGLQYYDLKEGNLQALAGLGPQSETAKQDTMLRESANTQVNAMRSEVIAFARSIIKRHAWYLFTDPIRELAVTKEVDGTDIKVVEYFTPEEREGDWLDYNFDIETYSTQDEPPSEKAQKLMMMGEIIQQNPELVQQAGYTFNAEGFYRQLSKYFNIPFNDLLKAVDPNMPEQEQSGQVPLPDRMKKSHTVNERISRSGTTQRGIEAEMLKANSQAAAQTANSTGEIG